MLSELLALLMPIYLIPLCAPPYSPKYGATGAQVLASNEAIRHASAHRNGIKTWSEPRP